MATRNAQSNTSARSRAADIIRAWIETRAYPDRLLQGVAGDQRAAVMEMAYGVVRQFRALEFIRAALAPKTPAPAVHAVLLIGLYQVFYMDRQQPHAVVNETVEAAKRASGRRAGDFVNAVLRRSLRERDALRSRLAQQSVGVRLSHPDNLLTRWRQHLEEDAVIQLCEWNNSRPGVVLRVNRLRARTEALLGRMLEAGIDPDPHPYAPEQCLTLPRGTSVEKVPGYQEGWFAVQDPSTLAAVSLLAPQPGERVLDLCAAPGGKTALIVEQMNGEGVVVAVDLAADRLGVLQTNLSRLGCDVVAIRQADATDSVALAKATDGLAPNGFDRILLDVPCTNTGVLRRRPDARWRFDEKRLREAVRIQRQLLDAAAPHLRTGGSMVYSTCSREPEENKKQVNAWLSENKDIRCVREFALFPPEDQTDGAYAALLQK